MSSFVCVECGQDVGSLYVEYTVGNIRLTRCSECTKVADKYVEHELILVFIDLILHRKPAYRHLIYNRFNDGSILKFMRWVPAVVIVTNTFLRSFVLRNTAYKHSVVHFTSIVHSLLSNMLEHFVFVGCVALYLYFVPAATVLPKHNLYAKQNKMMKYKLYLVLAVPELLKLMVIMLQIFDTETTLLITTSLLLLSLQFVAMECLTALSLRHLLISLSLAVLLRLGFKFCFYSVHNVYLSGIFL